MCYVLRSAVIGFIALASSATAFAEPAQIIILRHGEKKNGHELCTTGTLRAQALAAQFLGRNAERSLLPPEGPAAILAITLHTIETIEPTAQTWGLQVKASPVPRGEKGEEKDEDLDKSTKEAANDVLTNPAYSGKTVIMVWEHKRIASKENNATQTSLRELLHLDQATPTPPEKWEGENYNFFWIVTYGPGKKPTVDTHRQETFTGQFADLPDNGWGKPEQNKGKNCE
jgi:hypothetical protein